MNRPAPSHGVQLKWHLGEHPIDLATSTSQAKALLIRQAYAVVGLRFIRWVPLCLVLTISGCLLPVKPPDDGLVFEVEVNLNTTAPALSFTVICTNSGRIAKNVSEFDLILSSNPLFWVVTPDGAVYEGIRLSNLSMLAGEVLLQAGGSISQTYDLFGEWTAWRRGDGVRLSTTDVFSTPGEYNVTASYRPFLTDSDRGRRETTLVSGDIFVIPPDFWAPYRMNVSFTSLRISTHVKFIDYVVPTNQSNKVHGITIFGTAVNHGDPGWATIIAYLESDRGHFEKEQRIYFGAGASRTVFEEFEILGGTTPNILQYGFTATTDGAPPSI